MEQKNEAQTLFANLTGKIKDRAVVDIAGVEFVFLRDDSAFDQLTNEITEKNKLTPIKDYLLAIVEPAQKADLLKIINIPTIAPQIAEVVNGALVPKIEISLKN